tara:strand:- start:13 stop:219 length:207 start_codon:yes stop_codon:yes gene_type:complete
VDEEEEDEEEEDDDDEEEEKEDAEPDVLVVELPLLSASPLTAIPMDGLSSDIPNASLRSNVSFSDPIE